MIYESYMKLNIRSTSVTLEHSRFRLYLLSLGGFAAGQSRAVETGPRMAFSSLHTAARRATDRSALAVTQQCSECRTYHWTAAFISFFIISARMSFQKREDKRKWLSVVTL